MRLHGYSEMPTISFLFLWCWSSLVSRQKMLQPFGEMLLCSTVTPWPLGLFGSVAPTCHSGFRPAINVDDGRHEMATKPTQLGTVMIFSNSCNDPVGVKSTYLRHTMSHQHGHTYNLCPKQVDLGWCVIKANWLMHHQVSKSDVVYHTNTHLQVDPNNTYIHCADDICAIALFPSSCVAMLAAPAILL